MNKLLLAAAILLWPLSAGAQDRICEDRTAFVEKLASGYNEHQIAIGLDATGEGMVEIFASAEGTFTILVTNTAMVSCYATSGTAFALKFSKPLTNQN